MLTARMLLILGSAMRAKKAPLPAPLYVYCTKMFSHYRPADATWRLQYPISPHRIYAERNDPVDDANPPLIQCRIALVLGLQVHESPQGLRRRSQNAATEMEPRQSIYAGLYAVHIRFRSALLSLVLTSAKSASDAILASSDHDICTVAARRFRCSTSPGRHLFEHGGIPAHLAA
jgi:hypothetical protein